MAMRDVTVLMDSYRECARHLWNVYFSARADIGAALDVFGRIRGLLFESIVADELCCEGDANEEDTALPVLLVVPLARSLILIRRLSDDGNGYWDQEKDLIVGPDDIGLEFVDYFDFHSIPTMDFRFFRCRIFRFPGRPEYEGREALIEVPGARVLWEKRGSRAPGA
jgi:hypothetical protein